MWRGLLGKERASWPSKEREGGFQFLANNGKSWRGQSHLPAQKPLPQRVDEGREQWREQHSVTFLSHPPKGHGICCYSLPPASLQVRG